MKQCCVMRVWLSPHGHLCKCRLDKEVCGGFKLYVDGGDTN